MIMLYVRLGNQFAYNLFFNIFGGGGPVWSIFPPGGINEGAQQECTFTIQTLRLFVWKHNARRDPDAQVDNA